ncbi:MAG: MltA domain-containing protein [Rhizobiaceae bacterium]
MVERPGNSELISSPYAALIEFARAALSLADTSISSVEARQFFEQRFTPHHFGSPMDLDGFVTGYFEPELAASLQPSAEYPVPLHQCPEDLVQLDDHNRPAAMDPALSFGHKRDGKISEYFDRGEIQAGALDCLGLELVWLKNKTDAYFVHVQGSARLILPDGQSMRVGFAAKSGQPYTSIGKVLCKRIGISEDQMTADRLAEWMRSHPDDVDELMANNRSYIFFKAMDRRLDLDEGPVGAADIALTPRRSLAVDHSIHPYGLPIWVAARDDLLGEDRPFSRLMVAQDTGSAIIGPQRGDIFVGSGERAGLIAGKIRSPASFTLLVPRQ